MTLSRTAEGAVLLAILIAPWPYGSAVETAQFGIAALLLSAAAIAALQGSGVPSPPLLLPAIALPALAALQLLLRTTVAPVWTAEAFVLLSAMIATLLHCRDRSMDAPAASRLASAVLAVCVAQAAFGAVQWSIAPNRIYGRVHTTISMPFGSYVNHNHFAGLMAMGAPLALGLAYGHARRSRRPTPRSLALGGVSLALASATMASRSRGGMVALAAGTFVCLALFAATRRRGARLSKSTGLAAIGAIALIGFGLLSVPASSRRLFGGFLRGTADSSGSYRLDVAAATLRLAAAYPAVGIGLGAYEDAIPAFKRSHGAVRTTHAESDALEVLAEGGLLSLAIAGWLALALLRLIARHLERAPDPLRKGLAIGATGGVSALLVHSLTDFNLRIPSNALVFVVLLGLAASGPAARSATQNRSRHGLVVLGAGLLALSMLAAWRAYGAAMLDRALAAGDANARVESLNRVIRRHGYLAEAWRARGLAWRDLGTPLPTLRERRLAEATRDLDVALQLRPNWAAAWADRGWILAMRGRLVEARLDLERASRLDPSDPGIRAFRTAFDSRTR